MKKLLDTKFAPRKILLLMMSGIFFMGCADNTDESEAVYQASTIPIESGTEISVDLDGDGKEDKVRVEDNGDSDDLAKDGTRLIANVNGVDTAIKDYEGYVYSSRITTGDLSGDGKADVLLKRYIFGSNYGASNGRMYLTILHYCNDSCKIISAISEHGYASRCITFASTSGGGNDRFGRSPDSYNSLLGKWNRNIPIWNKMDHDSDIRNMYIAAA